MRHAFRANISAPGFASAIELPDEVELRVEGTLPAWLRGRLIHTGPALFTLPRGSYDHWFDGLAMLTSIHLADGRGTYRSRFLRSEAYQLAVERGAPVLGEFDTRPKLALRDLVRPPPTTDNANVNIVDLGGRVIAMTETSRHVELDPSTLETRGEVHYEDDLEGQLSTAHPAIDHRHGRVHNLLVKLGVHSAVQFYEQELGTIRRELVARLPVDRPSYMHSFAASTRFLVLTEVPLIVNPLQLRFGRKPFIECYQWRPDRGARLRVVRKDGGALVASATTEPMFVFHHVNAFENDGWIEVDLLAYPDASVVRELRLDVLRSANVPGATAQLVRISLRDDQLDQHVEPVELSPTYLELPRIDPRCAGRSYRYVFGVANEHRHDWFDQLVRIDVETGASIRFERAGWFFNEPLFMPAPEGDEGNGVVMSLVFDAATELSLLLVLDATDLEPIARLPLPQVIPFHFHGQFVDGERG